MRFRRVPGEIGAQRGIAFLNIPCARYDLGKLRPMRVFAIGWWVALLRSQAKQVALPFMTAFAPDPLLQVAHCM